MAKGIYDRFYNTRALLNHHCRCAVVIVFVAVYYLYSYSSWFLKMREFTTGVFKPIVTLSLRYLLTCLTIDYTIQQCKFMLKAQIVYLLGISLQNAEMIRCKLVKTCLSSQTKAGTDLLFLSCRFGHYVVCIIPWIILWSRYLFKHFHHTADFSFTNPY